MSKPTNAESDLPLPPQPPPPYEAIDSSRRVEAGTGTRAIDPEVGENTPLIGERIAPFTHQSSRDRLWRYIRVLLTGGILVLFLYAGVEISGIGRMGDGVVKKSVGIVG